MKTVLATWKLWEGNGLVVKRDDFFLRKNGFVGTFGSVVCGIISIFFRNKLQVHHVYPSPPVCVPSNQTLSLNFTSTSSSPIFPSSLIFLCYATHDLPIIHPVSKHTSVSTTTRTRRGAFTSLSLPVITSSTLPILKTAPLRTLRKEIKVRILLVIYDSTSRIAIEVAESLGEELVTAGKGCF